MVSTTEVHPSKLPGATEAQPPQVPGPIQITKTCTDPRTTAETTREPKRVPEAVNCEGQHEKCMGPYLTSPSYKAVSTVRSAIQLGSIIVGNCLCSGCICLCLWGFSRIKDLTQWEKRAFNAMSLLLSAILGFGIGFMFDRIGLLVRGTLLQRKCYSMEEVCVL